MSFMGNSGHHPRLSICLVVSVTRHLESSLPGWSTSSGLTSLIPSHVPPVEKGNYCRMHCVGELQCCPCEINISVIPETWKWKVMLI